LLEVNRASWRFPARDDFILVGQGGAQVVTGNANRWFDTPVP